MRCCQSRMPRQSLGAFEFPNYRVRIWRVCDRRSPLAFPQRRTDRPDLCIAQLAGGIHMSAKYRAIAKPMALAAILATVVQQPGYADPSHYSVRILGSLGREPAFALHPGGNTC